WLADQIAGLAQLFDDDTARFCRLKVRKLVIELLSARRIARLPPGLAEPDLPERAVRQDDRPYGQRQFTPPCDVGDVAERADHGDAASLFRVSQRMRLHWHVDPEQRRDDALSKQGLVALVIWMRDQRDARRNQFRSCRLDLDVRGASSGGGRCRRRRTPRRPRQSK